MSDDTIIQNTLAQPGQSQDERMPAELDIHHADVDERTPESLLAYAQRLAAPNKDSNWLGMPFVDVEGHATPGQWSSFFNQETLDGETKAPFALFSAFLELYRFPRETINRLTERHLDFFYNRVLRFEPRHATPDRAHVVIGLKKGAPPVRLLPSHTFTAGKDATGAELLYAPTSESIVNASRVESVRSIFIDHRVRGRVLFAPVANSSDGLGGLLPEAEPKWPPFGSLDLPPADVGFAVASPILRMKEGLRKITLSLSLDHLDPATLSSAGMADAFQAFLTGEKQWLGPYGPDATVSAGRLEFQIVVPESDPAVADYDAGVHGHAYTTDAPILQLFLRPGTSVGYDDLSSLQLDRARLSVDVRGVAALGLDSDAGPLDPKKSFLPFGSQPVAGSRFMIGCEEALSKGLSRLDLTLRWKGVPPDLGSLYANYSAGFTVSNTAFTASAVFRDRASEHTRSAEHLFDSRDATESVVLDLIGAASQKAAEPSEGEYVYALNRGRTRWGKAAAQKMVLRRPVAGSFLSHLPEVPRGFIVLTLDRSFLHAEYRQQSVQRVLDRIAKPATALLNEPYTPTLRSLTLSYTAHTADVNVSATGAADFANLDVQVFHIGPFGQMREHGHQRAALSFVSDTRVPLLPSYAQDGELLVGLSGLGPRDSVNVLFQVAEGSADPDVPSEAPAWSVLCDNYWKRLGAGDVVRDTTNRLLGSGIVSFVIPQEATTENTIMPPGLIWLKATVGRRPEATSQLLDVVANAVEVQFVMDSEDAAAPHLTTPLANGTIARLKTPIAPVNKIVQPYASFGGRPLETGHALRTRAAERLRHKGRAVTPWDYERLVLDAFPSVHRVKCIPHAKPGSWMAPGHALVVVVPDLRNKNAQDPLRPKVDADTIVRIAEHLGARTSGHARIEVKNPTYQKIRISCGVKFRAGYEFNFYSRHLSERLVLVLSPWAFDAGQSMRFGGSVYRSLLLNFVEEEPYVDYVTDFAMYTSVGDGDAQLSVERAQPQTPDVILVSDSSHDIQEVVSDGRP